MVYEHLLYAEKIKFIECLREYEKNKLQVNYEIMCKQ